MSDPVDRRSFLKIAGTTLGIGALYSVSPLLGAGIRDFRRALSGEAEGGGEEGRRR